MARSVKPVVAAEAAFADNHNLDDFYLAFENRFRGSEEEIKKRLQVYLPYFKNTSLNYFKKPVLDIGSGRGELLDLLNSNGVKTIGIDINQAMVARAKEKGFEAIEGDAVSYLADLKPGSLSAITGIHIVEHIPFAELITLFTHCHRSLQKEGFVLFETPNPENLTVGSCNFYYDPSHLRPLPPKLLAFTLEYCGFSEVEIKPLHPAIDRFRFPSRLVRHMAGMLFGPMDYAVIAKK